MRIVEAISIGISAIRSNKMRSLLKKKWKLVNLLRGIHDVNYTHSPRTT